MENSYNEQTTAERPADGAKRSWKHAPALAPVRWTFKKGRHLGMQFLIACGVDFYIRSEDRRVLETMILPYFAAGSEWSKILFVGCAWYTRGYRRLFTEKDYRTMEINPREARFGAARHVIDSLENVRRHFGAGELDVIICNGVFGWGLDSREAVEQAFAGCFTCLREGGIFVLGWNDLPDHSPFPLATCRALQAFTPFVFPPLDAARLVTPNAGRHTYEFFRKELAA